MITFAVNLIGSLGGQTAVARMIEAPVSTVHSWKENGIPHSRLAHLRLIAERDAIDIDWSTGCLRAGDETAPPVNDEAKSHDWPLPATGKADKISGAEALA